MFLILIHFKNNKEWYPMSNVNSSGKDTTPLTLSQNETHSEFKHYKFNVTFASKLKKLPGFLGSPNALNERYVNVEVQLSALPKNHDTFICSLLSQIEQLGKRKEIIASGPYNRRFNTLGEHFQSYLKLANTIEAKKEQTPNSDFIKESTKMLVLVWTSALLFKYAVIPLILIAAPPLGSGLMAMYFSLLAVCLAAAILIGILFQGKKLKEIVTAKFSPKEKQALAEIRNKLTHITEELAAKTLPTYEEATLPTYGQATKAKAESEAKVQLAGNPSQMFPQENTPPASVSERSLSCRLSG
jgi:hypothetical protein